MDIGSFLLALLDNSAITALLGFAVGYLAESRRRAQDRRERQVEREREAISELQFGLAELLHGTFQAMLSFERAELEVKMARMRGQGPLEAVQTYPNLMMESWYQNWLASIRKVDIMETRISDPELRRLANECHRIASEIQSGSFAQYEKKFPELQRATGDALERGGQVYQDLGLANSQPWYRRLLSKADPTPDKRLPASAVGSKQDTH